MMQGGKIAERSNTLVHCGAVPNAKYTSFWEQTRVQDDIEIVGTVAFYKQNWTTAAQQCEDKFFG